MTSSALRAAFARVVLGSWAPAGPAPLDGGERLGDVTLHPHQRDAVARCSALIARFGGALLADQVGLGKTFVALALARLHGGASLVAPATLRDEWARAARQAGMPPLPFTSFEALSRGTVPAADHPLVIIDEAHHARTPATRRHRTLAVLGAQRPLLLLTATPIHNALGDLGALLSLIIGERARHAPLADLQALVVRRTDAALVAPPPRPAVEGAVRLVLPAAEDVLADLCRLPPPVPPRDGGRADVLVLLGLIRAWESSDAALIAALRRRLAMARALEDALAEGRLPSRGDLAAWTAVENAQQLALPLLVTAAGAEREDHAAMQARVARHADALRVLLARLTTRPSLPDAARAAHNEWQMRGPPPGRVLAFTHSADTARALFARLRLVPGTCVLTADGAEVAGGRITRTDALSRFAPRARGARAPHPRDAIHLLIATDLLAEGLNLQDANTVVHLDLPWTPARLEQRVGRVARPGSAHARVRVLAMQPPASAESVARVETRLRAKLADAEVGVGAQPLGGLLLRGDGVAAPSAVESRESLVAVLATWRDDAARDRAADDGSRVTRASPDAPAHPPSLASLLLVSAHGWLAALMDPPGAPAVLVADIGRGAADDPLTVLTAARLIAAAGDLDSVGAVVARRLADWQRHHRAAARAGLAITTATPSRLQRLALARLARAVASAAPHDRSRHALLAARARSLLDRPANARRDATLMRLAQAHPGDDGHWLAAIAALDTVPG